MINKKGESVILGMSGGVDSAVAAHILKEQGYNVIGCTLVFGKENNKCCLVNDAELVANQLNIDYFTINVADEFENRVVKQFIMDYEIGLTPNPCPACNILKFSHLMEYADKHKIRYIATGHYAIIENGHLFSGVNPHKDQSYFLSRLPSNFLKRTLTPLGKYEKAQIRKMAAEMNLHVANKKDSMDICFVESDYRNFLKLRGIKEKSGSVVDKEGKIFANHKGVFNFTIGQRFRFPGLPKRYYVIGFDFEKNIVKVGDEKDLYSKTLIAHNINKLEDISLEKTYQFKIRSKNEFYAGKFVKLSENNFKVKFVEPVSSVTPGQLAVAYDEKNTHRFVVISAWIKEYSD